MDGLLEAGNLVLGNVLRIKSVNSDMFHALGGLTGALAVMLEFVERRLQEENPLDEVMMKQLNGTLANIGRKLDDFHRMYSREFCGVPYARWWVVSAPAFGLGSKRILTKLHRLEADLSGDLALIDLQIQSNQAMALFHMSGGNFLNKFRDAAAKSFWTSSFGTEPRAAVAEFADALAQALAGPPGAHKSRACAYAASCVSTAGSVDALVFNETLLGAGVAEWVGGVRGVHTTVVNASAGEVTCMAHHRGHLVTGSTDRVAKVFHLRPDSAPLLKAVLVGHTGAINDVSCEGGLVATASADGSVKVWRIMDGTLLRTIEHDAAVEAVFFASAGTLVTATCSSIQNVGVYDVATGAVLTKLYGHVGGTTGVSIADGMIVTVGSDRAVRAWDIETGVQTQEIAHAHASGIERVTAQSLIATYSDTVLKVWAVNKSGAIAEVCSLNVGMKSYTDVHGMQILDGRLFVALSDYIISGRHSNSRIVVVDVRTKRVVATVRVETDEARVHPTSLCVLEGALYVGFSDGGLRWYTDFVLRGSSVAPIECGADFRDCLSGLKPLLAGSRGSFVAAKYGSRNLVFRSGLRVDLGVPVTCVHADGAAFAVGAGDSIFSVSAAGEVSDPIRVGGVVDSLFSYSGSLYAQVFSPETRYAKYRKNRVLRVTRGAAVEVATIAQDVYCLDANICEFQGKLVYPGINNNEFGVYDMVEGAALPPVKYADLATVTHIRAFEDELWTVHGAMDIAVWRLVPEEYLVLVDTIKLDAEVSDLVVRGDAFIVGYTDGTIEKHWFGDRAPGKTVIANHKSGPVALTDSLALGVEMRLSNL